jgi:Ras-related protein Rab-8A
LTKAYYKGAAGIVLAFDLTNRESIEAVSKWVRQIELNAGEHVHKILVGTKSDCNDSRQVSYQEGSELASSYDM